MKIATMRFYDGSRDKVCRLGLADLFLELQDIIFDAVVNIEETPEANSGAGVREILDAQFRLRDNWQNTATGGTGSTAYLAVNQTEAAGYQVTSYLGLIFLALIFGAVLTIVLKIILPYINLGRTMDGGF